MTAVDLLEIPQIKEIREGLPHWLKEISSKEIAAIIVQGDEINEDLKQEPLFADFQKLVQNAALVVLSLCKFDGDLEGTYTWYEDTLLFNEPTGGWYLFMVTTRQYLHQKALLECSLKEVVLGDLLEILYQRYEPLTFEEWKKGG